MKVGIVTFTFGDNFGQRLQNYALQKTINDLGYSASTLKQASTIQIKKMIFKRYVKKFLGDKKSYFLIKRRSKFKKFDDNYIIYERKVLKPGNIKYINSDYDAFVAGSDQIWNLFSPDVNSYFFLQFAPKCKRIAYAPSIAANTIPDIRKNDFIDWINGFNEVSVREYSSVDIIETQTNIKARVVLDPTLLIKASDWKKIANIEIKKVGYILSIFLGREDISAINTINNEFNQEIIYINSISDIGPAEFITYILNADLVLTDSYHATLFSIIFEKPFIVFDRKSTFDMNSRFDSVFKLLNFENRRWEVLKENKERWKICDYSQTKVILENEKNKSLEFLKMQFDFIKKHNG